MRGKGGTPEDVHLVLERLGLLGEAGEVLVTMLQLHHFALQDVSSQAHVVPTVLKPVREAGGPHQTG